MTGGNAGLFWILPCVLHWVAALCGRQGRPEKGEKLVKISRNALKCFLGGPLGGIWSQLDPQGWPRVQKEAQHGEGFTPFGSHFRAAGQLVGVLLLSVFFLVLPGGMF